MVGNGVVPFPCGSGRGKTFSQTRNIVIFGSERGKTFSQTRNIVIFGSERGKMSFQTRKTIPKEKKEEKKEAGRV